MRGFRGLLFFCDFYFTFFLILHTNQKLEQQRRKGIEKQKKNILPRSYFFPHYPQFFKCLPGPQFCPPSRGAALLYLSCSSCCAPAESEPPLNKELGKEFPDLAHGSKIQLPACYIHSNSGKCHNATKLCPDPVTTQSFAHVAKCPQTSTF